MVLQEVLYGLFTLYMVAIIAVWLGPFIDFNPRERRWGIYICRIVDPFLLILRKNLPYIGPFDWAPIVALLIVWLLRRVIVGI
ncbi:MAG: YggT family protein [Candidatus Hydrogenedentes bacterium]|nr:YggT family protein [Candidatus Hydrogenedentota bacterium]